MVYIKLQYINSEIKIKAKTVFNCYSSIIVKIKDSLVNMVASSLVICT